MHQIRAAFQKMMTEADPNCLLVFPLRIREEWRRAACKFAKSKMLHHCCAMNSSKNSKVLVKFSKIEKYTWCFNSSSSEQNASASLCAGFCEKLTASFPFSSLQVSNMAITLSREPVSRDSKFFLSGCYPLLSHQKHH